MMKGDEEEVVSGGRELVGKWLKGTQSPRNSVLVGINLSRSQKQHLSHFHNYGDLF